MVISFIIHNFASSKKIIIMTINEIIKSTVEHSKYDSIDEFNTFNLRFEGTRKNLVDFFAYDILDEFITRFEHYDVIINSYDHYDLLAKSIMDYLLDGASMLKPESVFSSYFDIISDNSKTLIYIDETDMYYVYDLSQTGTQYIYDFMMDQYELDTFTIDYFGNNLRNEIFKKAKEIISIYVKNKYEQKTKK